ncbi:MAG: CotH kinase family protein [Prevotella sp.]|nr:CotH kinase family protein [Prevotella sp.]
MHLIQSSTRKYLVLSIVFTWMLAFVPKSVLAQETFQQKLAQLGYDKAQCTDWSDSTNINIPKPICAYVNLTNVTSVPSKWTTVYSVWMEVYDGFGNYFKKRIQMALQGRSTQRYPKRNFKVSFFNDEWIGDDTPDIKIGDWVEQDAFHFKAYYLDYFRGTGILCYKLYDQITRDRGELGRVWERGVNVKDPDSGALCHPDAFPCAVYFNNKFYGMYCWQLKKHRSNMNMKKHKAEHVYLDGIRLDINTMFGGTIDWSRLEVRNPKDLYAMSGKLYDRDNHDELMDETSPYYDLASDSEDVRKYKQMTAQVKHYLQNLSNYASEIQALINKKSSTATIRAAIEERFDVTSFIDYIIHNMVINNFDGLLTNYQWFTYDGKKWFLTPYDLDTSFGYFPENFLIMPASYYYIFPVSSWTYNTNQPVLRWVYLYFKDDIDQRYAYLRDNGILNTETIYSLFTNWYYSVGEANYQNEWLKWKDSPCLKETIANPQWELRPYTYSKYKAIADYSSTQTYQAGDFCRAEFRVWRAKSTVKGVSPYKQVGCKDSLARVFSWTKQRLASVDAWMNYQFTPQLVSYTLSISSVGWSTLCLPFKFSIPEGIELYTVTGIGNDGKLTLQKVVEPKAYTPYLVKGYLGDYLFVGQSEEANEDDPDYLVNECLHGCLVGRYVPKGCYVLQNQNGKAAFYKVPEDGKIMMGDNRAYLELDSPELANPIILDEEMSTYASVSEKSAEIVGIYNMDGVKLQHTVKGVNILKYSNGKTEKVVVK